MTVSCRGFRGGLAALCLFLVLPSVSATAAPTADVVIERADDLAGASFSPGTRQVSNGYVEEEFLVAGSATLYSYGNNPPLGQTDIVAVDENVPYQTRMIVRRPASGRDFSGTVVIEWWNSTAGFDSGPVWDTSADYFAREGIIYVGVTNSTTAIDFLKNGCVLFGVLPPACGERYATLSLPENGLAYEMMSQIAHRLKSSGFSAPLPADFEVERIFHAGQSQQGGSVVTYASAFHFEDNDGYFIQQAATARPINFLPACGSEGAAAFPDCTPRLEGTDRLVRTDLPVPVAHVVSETDIEILFGTVGRQADTLTFRYYEVAGASHLTVHKNVEVLPAGLAGPDPVFLEDLCQFEVNSTGDGPVYLSYVMNALWSNLERQVKAGKRGRRGRSPGRERWRWNPPAGVLIDTGSAGEILRDEFGNALGGIRLPAMDVPTATYTPGNVAEPSLPTFLRGIGSLTCRLGSSVVPFSTERLKRLYKNPVKYVQKVKKRTRKLRKRGFLLREDAELILDGAVNSNVACGLGFELVIVVPAAMWLRRRVRAGRRD